MDSNEFNKQKLLIEYMLTDDSIFQRCSNILEPRYFDKELQDIVQYMIFHSSTFSALPTIKQILAETGTVVNLIDNVRDQDQNWALTNIEIFCQQSAIMEAVKKSIDYIDTNDRGTVEKLIRDACTIGLQKDIGINYFHNPRERLDRIKLHTLVPTGWDKLDKKLYGGINRGELTVFAASSGMGKSLFLQNICLNWVEGVSYEWGGHETTFEPLNVVYITLELSQDLVAKRMDTMVTGIDSREIYKNLDDVELKVGMKSKKCGQFYIKYMSTGSTIHDLRAYLKNFEIEKGFIPDAIAVDYLDLLHPTQKISLSDLYIKDKYITEDLRSMAGEFDMLCVTASQLNRSAADESEHNHAMIAGGISKIQTADNVISIYASASMKERGEYSCQFLKTRSSDGVDSKILLGFDNVSLRITDLPEDYINLNDEDDGTQLRKKVLRSSNEVLQKIKSTPPRMKDEVVVIKKQITESLINRLQRLQGDGQI